MSLIELFCHVDDFWSLFGDKAYLFYKLRAALRELGIDLITTMREYITEKMPCPNATAH